MKQETSGRPGDAVKKAMNLLLYRDRTEYELRTRLQQSAYSEEEVEEAIEYVASFGYLNDRRYAENYVMSCSGRKSRAAIRMELLRRRISESLIDEALASVDEDESEAVMALLKKRVGDPHKLEQGEKRRAAAYLARRGFRQDEIRRAMRNYEAEQDGES